MNSSVAGGQATALHWKPCSPDFSVFDKNVCRHMRNVMCERKMST
jgi:hypothetical protein